jgi:SNF2 family DNA or RNA helicase
MQWTRGCPGGKVKADVYRGKQRDKFLAGINNGWLEALLVSYETLRMDFGLINAVDWSCVIFDEVHRLKRCAPLSFALKESLALEFLTFFAFLFSCLACVQRIDPS